MEQDEAEFILGFEEVQIQVNLDRGMKLRTL